MLPKYHIIAGAIATILIYNFFPITQIQVLTIFLASFLIDFDHYLLYFIKTKDFSLKKAYKSYKQRRINWFQMPKHKRREHKHLVFIFHGIEFWILIILLSYFNKIFLFIFIGVMVHMFLDYIEFLYFKEPFYSKSSQILVYLTNKNKKEIHNP